MSTQPTLGGIEGLGLRQHHADLRPQVYVKDYSSPFRRIATAVTVAQPRHSSAAAGL